MMFSAVDTGPVLAAGGAPSARAAHRAAAVPAEEPPRDVDDDAR